MPLVRAEAVKSISNVVEDKINSAWWLRHQALLCNNINDEV